MKAVSSVFAAMLLLAVQAGFDGAQAVNASGHCTGMTVTDYVSSDVDDQTASLTFVNITDGHLNFTTSSAGCVAITFSAPANVSNSGGTYAYMYIRTLLDGNQNCTPGRPISVFLASGQLPPITSASVTHVCKNVPAGAHNVQVQFSVDAVNENAELIGHTLTVTHR